MSDMGAIDLDNDEPQEYSQPSTETHGQGRQFRQGINKAYLYSPSGALKLVEILLSLIGFVASLAVPFTAAGFVIWVTVSAFITVTMLFCMELLYLWDRARCTIPEFVQLFYHALYTLKYLVATIISGIKSPVGPPVAMTCAFCFTALFIFLIDTVISYQKLQSSRQQTQTDNGALQGDIE